MVDAPQGWIRTASSLRRELVFDDFSQAWGFLTRVALACERVGHHPNWSNSWNRVTIELSTHDAGNTVTEADERLAEVINALLGEGQ